MNFCTDCIHNEGYCILFDDILSFENCVFKRKDEKKEDRLDGR